MEAFVYCAAGDIRTATNEWRKIGSNKDMNAWNKL